MEAVTIIVTLLVGLLLGAAATWVVFRSRAVAVVGAREAAAHADAATARAEASAARADLAHSQTEVERARGDVERSRGDVMGIRAEMAELQAVIASAEAERDAAMARAKELAEDRESLLSQFKVLSSEALERQGKAADASAEQRLKATEQLMAPMKEVLGKFENRLTEVEKERVEIAAELREQVRVVKATGDEVRRETSALTTALRKPQVRGQWGELQLKRVVELAGMVEHCDFVQQETSSTDERVIRPDLKVLLGGGKFVYVDSKVTLTAYLDAQDTVDLAERERYMTLFAKNVRSHVDQLSGKQYWKADEATPEFVVLFMPSEALYAEALQAMADLTEYAASRNIVIASPSTLIAMLRSVAYGWRQAALAQAAKEVTTMGQDLYDRLAKMGHHFDRVGRSLTSSVKAYNEAVGSMEMRVLPAARKFRDLKVTQEPLIEVHGVDETVRQITAPELTEDAAQVTPMLGRELRTVAERVEPSIQDLAEFATPPSSPGRAASV